MIHLRHLSSSLLCREDISCCMFFALNHKMLYVFKLNYLTTKLDSCVWQCILPVSPALWRLWEEDCHKFKASVQPVSKQNKKHIKTGTFKINCKIWHHCTCFTKQLIRASSLFLCSYIFSPLASVYNYYLNSSVLLTS